MVTISIILNLMGGLMFYNLSDKTKISTESSILKRLHKNQKLSKIVGGVLLCTALLLLMFSFGMISGFLFGFFLLSLQLCLIIVITPLQIINITWLGVIVGLCLIVETFIK